MLVPPCVGDDPGNLPAGRRKSPWGRRRRESILVTGRAGSGRRALGHVVLLRIDEDLLPGRFLVRGRLAVRPRRATAFALTRQPQRLS